MIVDLFGGMGGWSEGLRLLGLADVSFEWDAAACATRALNGHVTVRADVAGWPLDRLEGRVEGLIASPPCPQFSTAGKGHGRLLEAELAAAVRDQLAGLDTLEDHLAVMRAVARERRPLDGTVTVGQLDADVAEAALTVQPARWIARLRPEWVAMEQVPGVAGLWREYAAGLRALGYSAWTGVLNAADFGVPQTRRRAILVASRVRTVQPPPATHAADPVPDLFGGCPEPWVTMAAALGLTGRVGFARRDDTGTSPDGLRERDRRPAGAPALAVTEKARSWTVEPGELVVDVRGTRGDDAPGFQESPLFDPATRPARTVTGHDIKEWTLRTGTNTMRHSRDPQDMVPYERPATEPSPTVTGQAEAWKIGTEHADPPMRWKLNPGLTDTQPARRLHDPDTEPAPTIAFGHDSANWRWERPATTVAGDARLHPPGHKFNADDERRLGTEGARERYADRAGTDAVRLEVTDALVLQSFRPDLPVAGSRTKQFEQVGNAVPPVLAAHVAAAATGLPPPGNRKEPLDRTAGALHP